MPATAAADVASSRPICARPGCERRVGNDWHGIPSRHCSHACHLQHQHALRYPNLRVTVTAPTVVPTTPCPSNNRRHERIQVEQLRLIAEYLSRASRQAA